MNKVINFYEHRLTRARATAEAVKLEARRCGLSLEEVRELTQEARQLVASGRSGGSVLAAMYQRIH